MELSIDPVKAEEMIGKVVLVGVTRMDCAENIIGLEQYFGRVLRINLREGLVISRGDTGEEMSLPPMLERYEPAEKGKYKLKSTGRTVKNPDYMAAWTIYPPRTSEAEMP